MKNTVIFGLFVLACMTGCKGPKGPAGAPGGGRVVSTIYCNGTVTGAGALNGLDIEYNAVLTSSGDVYATASIIDAAAQTSGTSFYAAAEPGSLSAEVEVTADYIGAANGGYWSVGLDRNTLITHITYDDPDLINVVDLTFTPSACTVGNF
jgi:hypothetical protein